MLLKTISVGSSVPLLAAISIQLGEPFKEHANTSRESLSIDSGDEGIHAGNQTHTHTHTQDYLRRGDESQPLARVRLVA